MLNKPISKTPNQVPANISGFKVYYILYLTVEPHYSQPLACHLSITAACWLSQLHTHVYKLTPEIWYEY